MAQKPKAAKVEDAETRPFVAIFNIVANGETIPPGKSVGLTHEEFLELKAQGAVEGEWK